MTSITAKISSTSYGYKCKGKVNHAPQESVVGCSSPSSRLWARRWRTINVCDTWPVRRQTYSYLPSLKESSPVGWYQIILLGDRGTRVLTTCSGLHSTAGRLAFKRATYWSQFRHPTAMPPSHTAIQNIKFSQRKCKLLTWESPYLLSTSWLSMAYTVVFNQYQYLYLQQNEERKKSNIIIIKYYLSSIG